MKNIFKRGLVVAGSAAASSVAFAQTAVAAGPDLTPLTTGVDMSTVITAVLAVGVTMVGLYAAIKGAKIVIGMVRGG